MGSKGRLGSEVHILERMDQILNVSGHPVFEAMQSRETTYHSALADLTFAELCDNDQGDSPAAG